LNYVNLRDSNAFQKRQLSCLQSKVVELESEIQYVLSDPLRTDLGREEDAVEDSEESEEEKEEEEEEENGGGASETHEECLALYYKWADSHSSSVID